MSKFRYRALTEKGDVVHGTISAATAKDVIDRIEYLRLLPIETIEERAASSVTRDMLAWLGGPTQADVTTFTRDLALLLKAGARLEDSLELLAGDADIGRLRPIVSRLRSSILAGESLADALAHHPSQFPAMYLALVRVGEASGSLDHVLDVLGAERARAEAMRRKLSDAMQYPLFVLIAAALVMLFFVLFVLPQFSAVLRDFGARTDATINTFLDISDFVRGNGAALAISASAVIAAGLLLFSRASVRAALIAQLCRLPGLATVFRSYRTSVFCRNLAILLGSGLTLTATLRILVDIMSVTGNGGEWSAAADRVRHGGKLSEALAAANILPAMATRMIRIGEETGQVPVLAGRIAEFYEAKLQRHLDRIVGIVGPAAIILISTVVGGLIVSVMSALLSVTQLVG
ncbi:general secretion pathway protein GspF [Bradyrhizobium sp. SSBR45G]|uniref:type II secretion system F family protein n=1 Tax=unclassified Bradyrhizobium TaxID=2631580 RepID=UPI0023428EF6|nr:MULTISPECIES: type II secretion system F family protein [unclassified Bradyrhizobium]GLH78832.1 general secretion pathway protein GspF [Bradyrhizobium sp. SSBR45G]GLH86454.1 general secretion pathway protein GspF [Bradyrhizobium sp. SSBR45R]